MSRGSPAGSAGVGLLLAACVTGVAFVQPRLARETAEIKAREDVYLFPPPAELRAATFGYVAAVTDLLWAKLLVEFGVHFSEQRAFPDLNRYLDAIQGLDPQYKVFYEFVDGMLVFRPPGSGTEEDAKAARAYFKKGVAAMPYDPDVWVHYGQFVAFLAPSWIKSEAEQDEWRKEGANILLHAADLGAPVDRTLIASTMLRRFGESDAQIRVLTRLYAMTDDEEQRKNILGQLERLQAVRQADTAVSVVGAIERQWRTLFPFLSRGEFLLLGPPHDTARCAGPAASDEAECADGWDRAPP